MPDGDGPSWTAAVVLWTGTLFVVLWSGPGVHVAALGLGLLLWLVAVGQTWQRLRSGDPRALAVPVAFLAAWLVIVIVGRLVLGWRA